MVWDTIYGRDRTTEAVHEWGGIAYALAAFEANLPQDWEIVPLIKVGRDMAVAANRFLSTLTKRSTAARFVEVPEPNNRVVLTYESDERRCEQLTGGVPGWRWEELGPMVRDLDAIYINFISGFELTLEASMFLRRGYTGPIYADLHSLFLGVAPNGMRTPQTLEKTAAWFSCFDVVQLNEDEMALIGADPMEIAATAFKQGVRLLAVTLGEQGAVYFAAPDFRFRHIPEPARGPIQTARIPTQAALDAFDPTGCGDVFGGTLVAHLIRDLDIEPAIRTANTMALRNLSHRGASNLQFRLRGEIAPR